MTTDTVCKEVECGKGTCKQSSNNTFGFECECEPGWKQTGSDDDDNLKFLPCVVPNCKGFSLSPLYLMQIRVDYVYLKVSSFNNLSTIFPLRRNLFMNCFVLVLQSKDIIL
jgi:hypothetical protein